MSKVNNDCVLIMAGGTGGHVLPALAVAKMLRERGVTVHWLGTRRGIEANLVPAADIPIDYITITGLRGKSLLTRLFAPWQLMRALWQSLQVIRRVKPTVVLGMGGYVTGPGGVAAKLLRKPIVIHEQNAVAGLTNRLLAKLADMVLEAFPGSFAIKKKTYCTGNPVRSDISDLPSPAERFKNRQGPIRLLVLGGSLGAKVLNEKVPEALVALKSDVAFDVWQQTGQLTYAAAEKAFQAQSIEVRLDKFIDDMASAYAWADLVLCRAGAMTVAELAAAGVGALFVPYPHAVDNHQVRNAEFLVKAGAAQLLEQDQMTAGSLSEVLHTLCQDRSQLLTMAEKARQVAKQDSTQAVVTYCLETSRGK